MARRLAPIAGLLLALLLPGLPAQAAAAKAPSPIDWPAFLARHDLVWKRLPHPLGGGGRSWATG